MTAKWGEIAVKEVSSAINGSQKSGSPNELVKGLSTDSRKMKSGYIFLALKGEKYDGHNFLNHAINAGAMGVIVESSDSTIAKRRIKANVAVINVSSTLKALGDLASWWRKQWQGRVIAITGSNGKSTTKEITASILSLTAKTMKSPGNFNNLIGLPLTILLLQEQDKLAVLEMGMNMPGEIARLTRIANPDIGLITNVARAHLEGLDDLHGVMRAKGELLGGMSEEATAILNGDDEVYKQLSSIFQGNVITFGLGDTNQVRAEKIKKIGVRAQSFTIRIKGEELPVKIHLPGIHNVFNALSGAAIAFSLSTPNELIAQGLERFRPIKGRFNFIDLNGGIQVIDDTYNANPSSLRAALQTIKGLLKKNQGLVIGLGEMMELGKESSKYHFDAGQLVAKMKVRYLVVMGEHGQTIVEGACEGGMDRSRTHIATTHAEMSDTLKAHLKTGDILFVKGSRKVALDRVVEGICEHFGRNKREINAV